MIPVEKQKQMLSLPFDYVTLLNSQFNPNNQFYGDVSSSGFAPIWQLDNVMQANNFPGEIPFDFNASVQIPSFAAAADENNFRPTIPFNLNVITPNTVTLPNTQFTTFTPASQNNLYNYNPNNQFTAFSSAPENNLPHNPTSISINVGNQYTGLLSDVINFDSARHKMKKLEHKYDSRPVSETQFNQDSVLDQKRPLEFSLQPTNRIQIVPTDAENEYNYTGLLSDIINFDSAPDKKKKFESWTEDEHKLFLIGLLKFGEGDWKNIATKIVLTKSPTQVASHSQKFFLRQRVPEQNRKRLSIHDITTVDPESMARLLADRQRPSLPPAPPFSVNTTPPPRPPPPPPSYSPSTPPPQPQPPVNSPPLPPDGQYSEPPPLQPPPVYHSSPIASPVHYQSPPSPPSYSTSTPPSPWPTLAVYESLLSPIDGGYGFPPPPPSY